MSNLQNQEAFDQLAAEDRLISVITKNLVQDLFPKPIRYTSLMAPETAPPLSLEELEDGDDLGQPAHELFLEERLIRAQSPYRQLESGIEDIHLFFKDLGYEQ